MKKINFKDIRLYFMFIYAVINIVLIVQLFTSKLFPIKYILIISVLLILLFLAMYFLQYAKKTNKINKILGKILLVILSVLLIVGNMYLFKTSNTLSNIANKDDDYVEMSIVVLKDNPAKKINDLEDAIFGTISIGEVEYNEKTISKIEDKLGKSISTQEFASYDVFGSALYDGSVEAIILNEGFREMFAENHETFSEDTKVIKTYKFKRKTKEIGNKVNDVTENPFIVYISGIDTYGSISTVSRSDVNKLMVINPTTKQILLISVPRDYYIPQVCQEYQEDKLTHTGIFGVDCTVDSMSEFLDVDINYYLRVNFSSVINIVDALGGITIDNPVAFSSGGYDFAQGSINLTGESALTFSRERYSLAGGDNARVANQSRVLSGMINKATSPAIITNYMSFMDAISGSFQTSLSNNEITSLINMQLDDMSGWDIIDYDMTGAGTTMYSPANGFNSYVMIPDETSVAEAKNKIQQVLNGEVISE